MSTLRVLGSLVRADFFERIRRYSFLIALATTVFAGYLLVPPVDAGYRVLQVGVQRGIYNSPWIGLIFGLIAALHLPLLGFFLVKNAVERDRRSGVGQIIAATPISKPVYVFGKWLSNLTVLTLILSVLTAMAVVMQLIRAEETTVELWALVATIWLMGTPMLAIAAAIAVLFECVSFLRGGLGNTAYFFLWLVTLVMVMTSTIDEATDLAEGTRDPYGYTRQLVDIQAQVLADDPDAEVGTGLIHVGRGIERTFVWDGINWTAALVLERVMWVGIAVVVALVASIPFDRFDPARSRLRPERNGFLSRLAERIWAIRRVDYKSRGSAESGDIQLVTPYQLTPLATTPQQRRYLGVLIAELKLMLKGHSLIWYVGAIGLIIACLVNSDDDMQRYLVWAVLLWPIVLWSGMGNRERRNNTDQIIFSVAHPLRRQLFATWMAGFIIALFTVGCNAVHLIDIGQWDAFVACVAGAVFIPSLALTLGVWSGGRRLFEFIYLFWWYLGPVEGVPVFDYMGVTAKAINTAIPILYLSASVLLLGIAVVGRRKQLQN